MPNPRRFSFGLVNPGPFQRLVPGEPPLLRIQFFFYFFRHVSR